MMITFKYDLLRLLTIPLACCVFFLVVMGDNIDLAVMSGFLVWVRERWQPREAAPD